MKKLVLVLFLLLGIQSKAAEYSYMIFVSSDASETSMAVSNLSFSVSGTTLTATNTATSKTFVLSELAKMYFSTSANGISSLFASGSNGSVTVFNLAGVQIGEFSDYSSLIKSLQKGVYIIKQGRETQKISIP